MKNTDTIELTIADVVYRGKGLARLNGEVVFVPHTLPGEVVKASIVRRRSNFAEATLVQVLSPSPHRIAPVCPLAGLCPGCCYQHTDYAEEVRLKQSQFVGFLKRNVGIAPALCRPPCHSPLSLGYRNKITLHANIRNQERTLGYFAEDNRAILDVPQCPLAMPSLNESLAGFRSTPDLWGRLSEDLAVTFRQSSGDPALVWTGRGGKSDPWLTEQSAVGNVHVPRGSFFQVNPAVAEPLTSGVMEILRSIPPGPAIDLYCGVGIFALAAAQAGAAPIWGIDYDPDGIRAAERNASERHLDDARFVARPAGTGLNETIRRWADRPATLIVDPPRRGLEKDVVQSILRARFSNILYISCAADTLARDLALFVKSGYNVRSSRLYDMFPRTPYFESLTHLQG